jgi:hypothetical protein
MSGLFFVARLLDLESSWKRRAIVAGSEKALMPCALGMVIEPWMPLDAPGEFLAEVSEAEVVAWNRKGLDWFGYVRDFSQATGCVLGEFIAGPWQTKTEALQGLEFIKESVGVAYREEE